MKCMVWQDHMSANNVLFKGLSTGLKKILFMARKVVNYNGSEKGVENKSANV